MQSTESHPSQHQISDLARGRQPGCLPLDVRQGQTARRGDTATRTDTGARAHLRDGCPRCASALRQAACAEAPELRRLIRQTILTDGEPDRQALAELAGRTVAWATLLDAERAAAVELEESLLAMPPGERAEAVRTGTRYRTLGLIHHLLDHARREGFRDPARALSLAGLAVEASESSDDAAYPRPMVAEARAMSWAVRGNALRLSSDLFGAERAFHSARSHLEAESIHPVVRADVLTLLASLRIDQTRYAEAIEILDQTASVYRLFSEPHSEGRALFKMAKAVGDGGDPDRAVALLEAAEALLEPEADRKVCLMACHARVTFLNIAGRNEEAAALLDRLIPDYEATIGDFLLLQRLHWVGARIAHSRGELARAEAAYLSIRSHFEEREEPYEFALVSMDLAVLYLEQGRLREVRALAEEMLPIFTSRRIHQHALSALVLFQRAAEAENATAAYIRELAVFLGRARNNPYLAFEPPS